MTDERTKHKFIIRTANGELNLVVGEFLNIMRARFAREDIYASCATCLHMNAADAYNPICKKFNARPPLHIIVNACPEYWDNEDIPF